MFKFHLGIPNSFLNIFETGGFPVDIQNEVYHGVCRIKEKRVDGVWGEWSDDKTIIDNNDEWKQVQTRSLSLVEAHGGKTAEGSPINVTSWLLWVKNF